jgi:prepilin-type N-terminal cleavage/methylation domain-containing protein/prepilin-type processing-associated H-X9-DG protein
MTTTSRKPGRTAFTLLEILVVIAIIAVVAAMLSPALATAKSRSRAAACINNLHQLGLAFQMYANDFESRVPLSAQTISDPIAGNYGGNPARWTIHMTWKRYLPGYGTSYWQFPIRESVYICPSDNPQAWPIAGDYPYIQELGGSFLYNAETIAVDGHLPKQDTTQKILVIDGPTKTSVGSAYTFDQTDYTTALMNSSYPTLQRHFGKSNALFMDWHVESVNPATLTTNNITMN